MEYFGINGVDFSHMVSSHKIGYETLVSDKSGRNAAGDSVIDVVNRKRKLYITFRHTTGEEMAELLHAIADYVITVQYFDAKGEEVLDFTAYHGTPEPELYTKQGEHIIYKPMALNFIEL